MKYEIPSLLKHSQEMIVIDEIKDYGEDFIVAKANIKKTNIFLQNGVLPSFVFLEIIAQSISALAGIKAKKNNKKISLSLLLGCRNFKTYIDSLKVGANLTINAKASLLEEDGFGVYDCTMHEDDFLVAKGRLNVYTPDENFIKKVGDG